MYGTFIQNAVLQDVGSEMGGGGGGGACGNREEFKDAFFFLS